MMLMKEHIKKIMLFCMLAHMQKIIKSIMKMVVENHLANKSRIKNSPISTTNKKP